MKILLITPPSGNVFREECCIGNSHGAFIPAQMLLTYSYLKSNNIDVDFFEGNISVNPNLNYDLVICWVSILDSFYNDIEILKQAKSKGAKTVIVMPEIPESIAKEVMQRFEFIDFFIKNPEKEITIKNLVSNFDKFEKVKGIIYRKDNQLIEIENELPRKDLFHLNNIAPLNDLNLKKYKGAFVLWGKGCPYSCSYCLYRNTKPRYRPVDSVIKELKILSGKNLDIFLYSLAIFDKQSLKEIANKIIEEKINIKYYLDARAEQCDFETLDLLKKSGCYKIIIGVEHSDEEKRNKFVMKNLTDKSLYEAVDNCHKANITPQLEFILGYPQDTKKDIYGIAKIIKKANPCTYAISFLRPWKGTPAYEQCKTEGTITNDYTLDTYAQNDVLIWQPTKYLSKNQLKNTYLILHLKLLSLTPLSSLKRIFKYSKNIPHYLFAKTNS